MLQKVVVLSLTLLLAAGVSAQDPEENDVPGSEPAESPVPGSEPAEIPVPQFRRPFNLGINIPQIFNMKLLTGDQQGTGLGIDIPAILRLRLDGRGKEGVEGRNGPRNLLINLFGSDVFDGKRPPAPPVPDADYESDAADADKDDKEA